MAGPPRPLAPIPRAPDHRRPPSAFDQMRRLEQRVAYYDEAKKIAAAESLPSAFREYARHRREALRDLEEVRRRVRQLMAVLEWQARFLPWSSN